MIVTPETILRVLVFLLYAPISLLMYRLLFHRLSPATKHVAIGVLAAQVLAIVISFEIHPGSATEEWFWDIDLEWNFASVVAATQLALVGLATLLTAWLAPARPNWQRVCMIGVGLVFLFLGLEEFLDTKHPNPDWPLYYGLLGVALIAITSIVARRLPRSEQLWFILLLVGLLLMAGGALLLDELPSVCGDAGFLYIDGCLKLTTVEEAIELLGSWLALVAMLGWMSNALPKPPSRLRLVLYVFPVLWVLFLVPISPVPGFTFRLPAQPMSVQFESGVQLYGYRSDNNRLPYAAFLYVPEKTIRSGLGYSVHLVDQVSGDSIASRNQWADRSVGLFLSGKSYIKVYQQPLALQIPPLAPVNRALWVVLTIWRKQGEHMEYQRILESDRQQLSDTQVVLDELVLPAVSPVSSGKPIAVFGGGFALAEVAVPTIAQVGGTVEIRFTWRADTETGEDYVQFLHFVHEESGAQWGHDQQPLSPRLPTRLWYSGLIDSENWEVSLPTDLAPGRYAIFTGLYRLSDLERLPATDADEKPFVDARVPLGELTVKG